MKVKRKDEPQNVKKLTTQSLHLVIQNCIADLVRGKSFKGVTVEKLIKHLSTVCILSEGRYIKEIKIMAKNKQLAIGKSKTLYKGSIPFLKRIIRPNNSHRRECSKKDF